MAEIPFHSKDDMKSSAQNVAKGIEHDLDLWRGGDKTAKEKASKTVDESVKSHKEFQSKDYVGAINEQLNKDGVQYHFKMEKDASGNDFLELMPGDLQSAESQASPLKGEVQTLAAVQKSGDAVGDSSATTADKSHHPTLDKLFPGKKVDSSHYPNEKVDPADVTAGGDGQRHYARNEKGEILGYQAPNGSTWVRDEKNPKLFHKVDAEGKPIPDEQGSEKNTLMGTMHTLPDGTFVFANEHAGKDALGNDEKAHLTVVGGDGTRHDLKGDAANTPEGRKIATATMEAIALAHYQELVDKSSLWVTDPRRWNGILGQPQLEELMKKEDLSPEAKFAAAFLLATVKRANEKVPGGGVEIQPGAFNPEKDPTIAGAAAEITAAEVVSELNK